MKKIQLGKLGEKISVVRQGTYGISPHKFGLTLQLKQFYLQLIDGFYQN